MELISREDAVRVIWESVTRESATKKIDELPTIEERKEGHWIGMDEEDPRYDYYKCSNCWNEISVDHIRVCDIGFTIEDFNFCPHCGAKMRGE